MRILLCSMLALAVVGCAKKENTETAANNNEAQAKQDQETRRKLPTNIGGLNLPDDSDTRPKANTGQTQKPNQQPAPNRTIPKEEARLVEWPKAKEENPGLEVVENKVQGSDPISVAASAYVSAASRIESLNFQNSLNQLKALNGRPATFQEFQDLAKQLKIQFNHQPPYRLYGYDTSTGAVVVLEDKAEKKRIYEEKGIPYDE